MDYIFFDQVNQTLWDNIKAEGNDFWAELKFFRAVKQNVSDFCQKVLTTFASQPVAPSAFRYVSGKGQFIQLGGHGGFYSSFRGKTAFEMGGERMNDFMNRARFRDRNSYDDVEAGEDDFTGFRKPDSIPKTKLHIPASEWSPAFTFDAERCMGMYFNPLVFKNLLRVRQHPHLCKALNNIKQPPAPTPDPKGPKKLQLRHRRARRWWKLNLESFDPRTRRQAVFHPAYCAKQKATKHRFAKEVVYARNAYGFSYVHKG